ncbi:MAG: helix-turn-helix transcriptional regulator, partial [Nitrospiraceae bacterium]|nr:helix-turn-helix transcriptional regulator [Nitrospiraceae bacterium]
LKVLKDAGLLRDRRDGRWMYYSLNSEGMDELELLVEGLKQAAQSAGLKGKCY